MTEREKAADHLRVIRSLMERATVYRTITWPTALFGGTLAVILAALLYFREDAAIAGGDGAEKLISVRAWVVCWMVSLAVTCAFNTCLVIRKARREDRPVFSPGLKMALRAFAPPMLAGGVVGTGLILSQTATAAEGAAVWVVCYGLGLLATRPMAPPSIPVLGWALLLFGILSFTYAWSDGSNPIPYVGAPSHMESPMLEANLIMGVGFGLFHLVYGFFGWRAGKSDQESGVE